MTTHTGRVEGMEFVLPVWFYNSVIDRSLVLTIDPAYFRLTGGIERWLYRVARKHAGLQPEGWAFEVSHLHQKSGSAARPSDFAFRSEEHTSELQSLIRNTYAVLRLQK